MPGIRMCLRRVGCTYNFFPSTFAMIIMSIGHYVTRKRATLTMSSSYLFGGTRVSWLGLRCASVVKLRLERMECMCSPR